MHPLPVENVDGTGKRCGDRRNEDGVASVVELFDDEGRDKGLVTLEQRGLPGALATLPSHLVRKTAKERIARNSFEDRPFDPISDPAAHAMLTQAPMAAQIARTSKSDRRSSAGIQSGSNWVKGCTRAASDFMPLISNRMARYTGTTMSTPRMSALARAANACFMVVHLPPNDSHLASSMGAADGASVQSVTSPVLAWLESESRSIAGCRRTTMRRCGRGGDIGLCARHRAASTRRQFAPRVLDQLALIALGQAARLSLDEIRSMLSPEGGPNIDRKLLAAKAEEIDTAVKQLRAVSRGLRHAAVCRAHESRPVPDLSASAQSGSRWRA